MLRLSIGLVCSSPKTTLGMTSREFSLSSAIVLRLKFICELKKIAATSLALRLATDSSNLA